MFANDETFVWKGLLCAIMPSAELLMNLSHLSSQYNEHYIADADA